MMVVLKIRDSVPSARYSSVCNILLNGESGSSLLIESTASMIYKRSTRGELPEASYPKRAIYQKPSLFASASRAAPMATAPVKKASLSSLTDELSSVKALVKSMNAKVSLPVPRQSIL